MKRFGLAFAIVVILVGTANPVFATVWDLRTFFPNDVRIRTHYLVDTFNEAQGTQAVHWFEYLDPDRFRQYNTNPGDRCHYDDFTWTPNDLRYVRTVSICPNIPIDTSVFSPLESFVFLPRFWNDAAPWSYSGTTTQIHYLNGVEDCRGTNEYTQDILGWEEISPGQTGIRFRTKQRITWATGPCQNTSTFEENWWFILNLPIEGSLATDRALKRTMGGENMAAPVWDIWFDVWRPLPPFANRDFDRDWKSDILWRHSSGTVAIWLMNGTASSGSGSPGSVGNDWQIAGVGDFNGDGKADILWRHSSGTLSIWLMNGTAIAGSGSPGSAGNDWQIAGVGDFNGDGKADILWRNTTSGSVAVWLMNGTAIIGSGIPGSTGNDWQIAGVGDFNNDGKADIVWRNTTSGTVSIWVMNGTAFVSGHTPGSRSTDWQLARVGDFNGDGGTDILWRNTNSGVVSLWLMSGTSLLSQGDVSTVTLDWQIAGVGDFNGDRRADILWRQQPSGTVAVSLMSGFSIIGSGVVGTVGTDWQIQ